MRVDNLQPDRGVAVQQPEVFVTRLLAARRKLERDELKSLRALTFPGISAPPVRDRISQMLHLVTQFCDSLVLSRRLARFASARARIPTLDLGRYLLTKQVLLDPTQQRIFHDDRLCGRRCHVGLSSFSHSIRRLHSRSQLVTRSSRDAEPISIETTRILS